MFIMAQDRSNKANPFLVISMACAGFLGLCTSVLIIVVIIQHMKMEVLLERLAALPGQPAAAATPATAPASVPAPGNPGPAVVAAKPESRSKKDIWEALRSGDVPRVRAILAEHPDYLNAPVGGSG